MQSSHSHSLKFEHYWSAVLFNCSRIKRGTHWVSWCIMCNIELWFVL